MEYVSTTVSISHFYKRLLERLGQFPFIGMVRLILLFASVQLAHAANGEPIAPEVSLLRLERADDGLYLNAAVRFELSPAVEDALLKGIPMFFLAEADVFRHRWYWANKKVASASRHYRLSYQPLTRRWRLNTISANTPSTGVNLGQNFDSLPDALAVLQRVSRWKIAELHEVDKDAQHDIEFRFRLDVTQLPRPFQLGAIGSTDWTITMGLTTRLVEPSR